MAAGWPKAPVGMTFLKAGSISVTGGAAWLWAEPGASALQAMDSACPFLSGRLVFLFNL